MQDNSMNRGLSSYFPTAGSLELGIKDYITNRRIDPARVLKFKMRDCKEYMLTIRYTNKKAMSFQTDLDDPSYEVMWVSDDALDDIVRLFGEMYVAMRDSYPEANGNVLGKVEFGLGDGKKVSKSGLSLYEKGALNGLLAGGSGKEFSFSNEYFNVKAKKVRLESGANGVKVAFESDYNFSKQLASMIGDTRVEGKNRDADIVADENAQIAKMLARFLEHYAPTDSAGLASDEHVPGAAEHMFGFSRN